MCDGIKAKLEKGKFLAVLTLVTSRRHCTSKYCISDQGHRGGRVRCGTGSLSCESPDRGGKHDGETQGCKVVEPGLTFTCDRCAEFESITTWES